MCFTILNIEVRTVHLAGFHLTTRRAVIKTAQNPLASSLAQHEKMLVKKLQNKTQSRTEIKKRFKRHVLLHCE